MNQSVFGIIFGSWFLFTRIWISVLVAVPILVWMGFFLVIYPKQMQAYLNELDTTLDKPS
jgi:hypothetical protein